MNNVVIHQPDFIPYYGFFHRLTLSDLYIVLDHVQFERGSINSWIHRDLLKTQSGKSWISVGTKKCNLSTPINMIELAETNWKVKNLNLIYQNYHKSPFYNEFFPIIRSIYEEPCSKLSDFNMKFIKTIFSLLNINTPIIFSSDLISRGSKNNLLIALLKEVRATSYLSGSGSRAYMDQNLFERNQILVNWHEFHHPIYKQQYGEFIPNLSIIDLIFNMGITQLHATLRDNNI